MVATDGGELGPLVIPLSKIKEGEKPTLELVGIGVKLAPDGDALRVDGVFPGSGAEAAGIVTGDRLVAVDGLPVTQLGLDGAVSKIRGAVGTTVSVTVQRGVHRGVIRISGRAPEALVFELPLCVYRSGDRAMPA